MARSWEVETKQQWESKGRPMDTLMGILVVKDRASCGVNTALTTTRSFGSSTPRLGSREKYA